MNETYKQALVEVDEILKVIDPELLKKVPKKFIEFIKGTKDPNYKFTYNKELDIQKQELKSETKAILSLMYRSYWCSQAEKAQLEKQDQEELIKIKKEQEEKYNIDNIFKNKKEKSEEKAEIIPITKQSESIVGRILKAIKSLFHKNRKN